MFGAFRAVRQAKRHGLTLLHVWLTPTSLEALKAIQAHEQLSGTDAVNRALQLYAQVTVP